MKTRFIQALDNENGNYLLPFFWQHGEEEKILREYMAVIHGMGIGAVCVESRPHPDFVGPGWWRDLDVIMDEAKARNMRVWILDDKHFPTGYANGVMHKADPALHKWVIYRQEMDLVGPSHVNVEVSTFLQGFPWKVQNNIPLSRPKELLYAGLYQRRDDQTTDLHAQTINLTDQVVNGYIPVDVPDGFYRLVLVYKCTEGGMDFNDYVNFLTKDSVKAMLDEVYEPHYARYRADFGQTLAGFFSDEPGFYNTLKNIYQMDGIIGKEQMPLPWSSELEERLRLRGFTWADLPSLWYNIEPEQDRRRRYIYMDCVTALYQENFCSQVGDWCRAHGCEYIGHIVEDNNNSGRLGPSAGHFFRALAGQSMSGIDIVNLQMLPGKTNTYYTPNRLDNDGEFFHFALAKLAASDAHIHPEKKGRAMVELFGCYGWSEGLEMMKWMADFMLVRGINVFVPHAFSPNPFPDYAPPHFYAHGHNPQAPYMGKLFRYMNRVAHLLNDGKALSRIGILYPAEAEWTGETMQFQKAGRICMECQADYEVVPVDALLAAKGLTVSADGMRTLMLGYQRVDMLVIPEAEYLPFALLDRLAAWAESGFEVIFIHSLPKGTCMGDRADDVLSRLAANCPVLSLLQLKDRIQRSNLPLLSAESGREYPHLRAYQYDGEGYRVLMIRNESIASTISDVFHVGYMQPQWAYDAYENVAERLCTAKGMLSIRLEPGETRLFVEGEAEIPCGSLLAWEPDDLKEIIPELTVSTAVPEESGVFHTIETCSCLKDYLLDARFADFHGTIRYEFDYTAPAMQQERTRQILYLDEANEFVRVSVNGTLIGEKISRSYAFPIGEALKEGVNHVVIENVTTVFPYAKDKWSLSNTVHALGITGKIWIGKRTDASVS